MPSSLESLDPLYRPEALIAICSQTRESILEKKGIDLMKDWDLVMCVEEHESILLDSEDLHLRVIKSLLLPRDMHCLNYTSDSADDMSRKRCQNP